MRTFTLALLILASTALALYECPDKEKYPTPQCCTAKGADTICTDPTMIPASVGAFRINCAAMTSVRSAFCCDISKGREVRNFKLV
ncbi:hypothetical protein VC83_06688 [Pseudogymnoascus destructans]|uniref:Hydrophobin n=1 Tax=Pseudogymnoascus destructans TaxID=655981 RepID=A0A177A590_9PEZI|nr:uncharacterized protein VC83_06688 [Pseudogymnoascus destructans]OAF56411.2 hypothetical protein VC83_06688 [Pseudogymnoascus destructans]